MSNRGITTDTRSELSPQCPNRGITTDSWNYHPNSRLGIITSILSHQPGSTKTTNHCKKNTAQIKVQMRKQGTDQYILRVCACHSSLSEPTLETVHRSSPGESPIRLLRFIRRQPTYVITKKSVHRYMTPTAWLTCPTGADCSTHRFLGSIGELHTRETPGACESICGTPTGHQSNQSLIHHVENA